MRTSVVVLGMVRVRWKVRVALVLPAGAVRVVVSGKPGRCDRASRNTSKRVTERPIDSGSAGLEDNA